MKYGGDILFSYETRGDKYQLRIFHAAVTEISFSYAIISIRIIAEELVICDQSSANELKG